MAVAIPRRDLTPTQLDAELNTLIREASNVYSIGGNQDQVKQKYLEWIESTESRLQNLFQSEGVIRDLYGEHYDRILTNPGTMAGRLIAAITTEVDRQRQRLSIMQATLAKDVAELGPADDQIVGIVDTNALLHGQLLDEVGWRKDVARARFKLMVPLTVIDELDELSYRSNETAIAAHKAIKYLQQLRGAAKPWVPVKIADDATLQVLVDRSGFVHRVNRDQEILEHGEYIAALTHKPVVIVTSDYGMRLRASAAEMEWCVLGRRSGGKPDPPQSSLHPAT